MNIQTFLFYALSTIILFGCLLVAIIGVAGVIRQEIIYFFDIDIIEAYKKRRKGEEKALPGMGRESDGV